MANNYKYPRVDINSFARVRSTVRPDVPDTTVLFMPIMSSTGPSREIIKIHDLDTYTYYFGKPAFDKMGISTILLTRWLNNRGTLYAYRMVDKASPTDVDYSEYVAYTGGTIPEGNTVATPKINVLGFKAKYSGEKYNDVTLTLSPIAAGVNTFTVQITMTGFPNLTEVFNRVNTADLSDRINANSELIKDFYVDLSGVVVDGKPYTLADLTGVGGRSFKFTDLVLTDSVTAEGVLNAAGISLDNQLYIGGKLSYYTLLENGYAVANGENITNGVLTELFLNVSATAVDLLVDTGYPATLKEAMYNSMKYVLAETQREDLFVAFSTAIIKERNGVAAGKIDRPTAYTGFGSIIKYTFDDTGETDGVTLASSKLNGWFAVFEQYGVVVDNIYNSNAELFIPLSIMFAQNVAYNDINYSMHNPTAGEIYGAISAYKSINMNPNAREKDELFKARFNYAEKSSNSTEIMTNRTFYHQDSTGLQSALDFINNVRVKNKIVRDLRIILRKYLYQYASSDTLLKATNECNAYINTWITNKALVSGSIDIQIDPYTEEYVSAIMNIKFRGCIEFIEVSIYID